MPWSDQIRSDRSESLRLVRSPIGGILLQTRMPLRRASSAAFSPRSTTTFRAGLDPMVVFAQPLEVGIRVVVAGGLVVALISDGSTAVDLADATCACAYPLSDPMPVAGEFLPAITASPVRHAAPPIVYGYERTPCPTRQYRTGGLLGGHSHTVCQGSGHTCGVRGQRYHKIRSAQLALARESPDPVARTMTPRNWCRWPSADVGRR